MSGYRGMTPEEFVDFLIDENGLASFVDEQMRGWTNRDELWGDVTYRIWYLSANQWQPTPDYVASLYDAQCERLARKTDVAA